MESLAQLLKAKRKELRIRSVDLAKVLRIDQALISKYENGKRLPTKDQIKLLAKSLEIVYDDLLILYYKDLMLKYLSYDEVSIQALELVKDELENVVKPSSKSATRSLKSILAKLDKLHARYLKLESSKHKAMLEENLLHFVYTNCRLNGNTLSKEEVKQIHQEGLTIAGKSIKEHFEVMNHYEILQQWMNKKSSIIDFNDLIDIHKQAYKGVQGIDAGELQKSKDSYTTAINALLRQAHKDAQKKHPITIVSEFRLKFLALSPFQQANQTLTNLICNRILLQQGYLALDFGADKLSEFAYAEALEEFIQQESLNKAYECFGKILLGQYQQSFGI